MRGPYSSSISGSTGSRLKQEYKTWYRTDKGQKVRTPLPFRLTRGTITNGPIEGLITHARPALKDTVSGHPIAALIENAAFPNVDLTNTYNVAIRKWYDKARTTIQGGVDYAERGQTIRLAGSLLRALRNPAATLARAARGLSKKQLEKTLLKDIPGAYLAFHFGIEPLIKELHDLMKMYEETRPKKRLVVASHTGRYAYATSAPLGQGGYPGRKTYRAVVRVAGVIEETDQVLVTLDALGLLNPLDIAWELVPYSFVVDWFYPINLYLNTLFGIPGHQISNGYTTKFVHSVQSYTVNDLYDPYFQQTYTGVGISVERSLVTWPAPTFQKSLNKWSTSLTRAVTSISLLSQILYNQRRS